MKARFILHSYLVWISWSLESENIRHASRFFLTRFSHRGVIWVKYQGVPIGEGFSMKFVLNDSLVPRVLTYRLEILWNLLDSKLEYNGDGITSKKMTIQNSRTLGWTGKNTRTYKIYGMRYKKICGMNIDDSIDGTLRIRITKWRLSQHQNRNYHNSSNLVRISKNYFHFPIK